MLHLILAAVLYIFRINKYLIISLSYAQVLSIQVEINLLRFKTDIRITPRYL